LIRLVESITRRIAAFGTPASGVAIEKSGPVSGAALAGSNLASLNRDRF